MARFVLMYFRQDEDAEEFVALSTFAKRKIVGIYRDPLHKPCECGNEVFRNNRLWGLHRIYGWPVHKKCGRISKGWRSSYGKRMFQVFGKNLLPWSETPKSFRDWKQDLDRHDAGRG